MDVFTHDTFYEFATNDFSRYSSNTVRRLIFGNFVEAKKNRGILIDRHD